MSANENIIYNNALRAIACNEHMSKQIDEMIGKLDREIDSLKDTYDYIMSHIELGESLEENDIPEINNLHNIRRLRKPYFSTDLGLIPFTNEIEKQRIEHGSLDFYQIKSQLYILCSEKDLEILKDSVCRNVYDIELYRIKKSKDKSARRQLQLLNNEFHSNRDALLKRCDTEMLSKIDWQYISIQDLEARISAENCRRFCDKLFNPKYDLKKFTDEENKEIINLVNELGCEGTWCEISERMTTKNKPPFICFKQWSDLTSKIETSDEWGTEEDELLFTTAKELCDNNLNSDNINWRELALLIPNRSAKDCERRWISIVYNEFNRTFSAEDDYEMLLLIRRLGKDNWPDIARNMRDRNVESCQRRYCEIVDALCEWTYLEDRRLWLLLRPRFKELWQDGKYGCVEPWEDLNIYKSIITYFNGRDSIVIRHRYRKLCKWFQLWNQYYMHTETVLARRSVKVPSLLTDNPEDKERVMDKIREIIQNSEFFGLIRKSFFAIGSKNPDKDTQDLIAETNNGNDQPINDLINKTKNKKVVNFIFAIKDIRKGIFIPQKFDDNTDRSVAGLKYPDRAEDNLKVKVTSVREFESKLALSKTVLKELNDVLKRNVNMTPIDRLCISKLIDCDGTFTAALNSAIKSHGINLVDTVDNLLKYLPDILLLMMNYVYYQEHRELTDKNMRVFSNKNLSGKPEQIAQLLMYRDLIPSIYKTHLSAAKKEKGLITKYLPPSIRKNLISDKNIAVSKKNIMKTLASLLKFPALDSKIKQSHSVTSDDAINNIPLQTPDRYKFNLIRNLILQKGQLLSKGAAEFYKMVKIRYDSPVTLLKETDHTQNHTIVDKPPVHLSDPRFLLLKSRLLSSLATTVVAARISPFACAIAGDKLCEEQNVITACTDISDNFSVVECSKDSSKIRKTSEARKRRILAIVDHQDQESSATAGAVGRCPVTLSHDTTLTRRHGRVWTKLFAPEANRSFFISRAIFDVIKTGDFTIESINGVIVDDFLK